MRNSLSITQDGKQHIVASLQQPPTDKRPNFDKKSTFDKKPYPRHSSNVHDLQPIESSPDDDSPTLEVSTHNQQRMVQFTQDTKSPTNTPRQPITHFKTGDLLQMAINKTTITNGNLASVLSQPFPPHEVSTHEHTTRSPYTPEACSHELNTGVPDHQPPSSTAPRITSHRGDAPPQDSTAPLFGSAPPVGHTPTTITHHPIEIPVPLRHAS